MENRFEATFGGWTLEGETRGGWRDESGREYVDVSRSYIVSLDSLRQVGDLLAVADWARDHFRQEAVYVAVGDLVEIV